VSGLHRQLGDYLALRRAMGFKLERHAKLLGQFVDYLAARDVTILTVDCALAWASAPSSANVRWWAARLSIVRGFAAYLHALDPAHQVPPRGLLPHRSRRVVPYLYTDREINALIATAGGLSIPLRAATYQVLVGLLAVTGMRVGEAIRLDREDFHDQAGVLTVRNGKFGKSRQLPLHPTTTARLGDYLGLRDQLCSRPSTTALLLSARGYRLRYERLWETFHRLVGQAGLRPRSPGCVPRIHDLRHTFAVTTMLGWYRDGADVPALLPRLST
jgi:integrase/recombinase XerD